MVSSAHDALTFGGESRDSEQDDHGPSQLEAQPPIPARSEASADGREIIGEKPRDQLRAQRNQKCEA
jgi:hypothetical protein